MSKEIFDFLRRYESFKESPQYQFYSRIRENRLYLSILRDNYRDVYKIVKFHNSPDSDKILWMNLNPKIRWKTQVKVIKSISNYLSCLYSVVEYNKNKLKSQLQKEPNIYKVYKRKNKLVESNPLHNFIIGLRHYVTHYSHLKLVSSINYSREAKNRLCTIYIPKVLLLEDKEWNSLSLSLLGTLEDKVYLIDLINEHYKLFIQLQDWTYLNLFLVNYNFSAGVYEEMQSLLNEATSLGLNYNLPFDKAYLRYYKYILNKSSTLKSDLTEG